MSTPSLSQADLAGYAFVALLGFIILRRTYAMTQGVRATTVRLTVLPAIYVALYVAELAGLWYVGTGSGQPWLRGAALAADGVLVVVGVALAYRATRRTVHLYRPDEDPEWHYRVRPLLSVLYVALFFVRVGIETVVLGESPLAIPTAAQLDSLSSFALYSLFLVDALWGLTTGFLVGRSAAVYTAWQEALGQSPAPLP
jgi:hypothetical protein